MASPLLQQEPRGVWKHFAALSAIPRASEKEEAARRYVLDLAARLQLESVEDAAGNIVVRKPARPGREGAIPTAIQGHLDMVCEKNEGTAHNFDTDPIHWVLDGDWLKADGTTLGADNGVGASAALAVMESTDVAHGPLELVFTVNEENGLTGVSKFPAGRLRSKYLFNLDNEEEFTLCIGCAGGINSVGTRKIARLASPEGQAFRLRISGLAGGHSGVDIHRGRGNAVRVLARLLRRLREAMPVGIAEIAAGSRRNAIAREGYAIVVVDAARVEELKKIAAAAEAEGRADLGSFDAGLSIAAEPCAKPERVIEPADVALIVNVLLALPHGVLAMSPDLAGLVQTSTNLATVATSEDQVEIATSQRSAIESSKLEAARMAIAGFDLAGFRVEHSGEYPGWKPEPESDIVRTAIAEHEKVTGRKPELIAMHAGLECGVIGEKHPGMQMISFGPHIVDVHSPSEKLKVSSVAPFYRWLTGMLERI